MSYIGILIIQLFALLVPGPDFLLVARTGITGSKSAVCKVSAGICAGALIWIILSLLGLHILFQTYPVLNRLVMFGGGCYLMYLAYCIMQRSTQEIGNEGCRENYFFLKGLMCNLSNPKAIIYFASIFSVLPLGKEITDIFLIIFLILVESFLCFVLLGILFSHPAIKKGYYNYSQRIDLVSAVIFAFFALLLFIKFVLSFGG